MTPEERKKKFLFHSRRGMWELDKILIPFVEQEFETLSDSQLGLFEEFLEEPDPTLFLWLIQSEEADDKYKDLVQHILTSVRG